MYKASAPIFGVVSRNNCSNSPSETRLISVASPSTFPIFFFSTKKNWFLCELKVFWSPVQQTVSCTVLLWIIRIILGQSLSRASYSPKQKKLPKEVPLSLSAPCFVYWSLLLLRDELGRWDGIWWDALSDQAFSYHSLSPGQQKQQDLLFRVPNLLPPPFNFFSRPKPAGPNKSLAGKEKKKKKTKPTKLFPAFITNIKVSRILPVCP